MGIDLDKLRSVAALFIIGRLRKTLFRYAARAAARGVMGLIAPAAGGALGGGAAMVAAAGAQLAIGNGGWMPEFGYIPDVNREHLIEFERGYMPEHIQELWDLGQNARTIYHVFRDADLIAQPWMFANEADDVYGAFAPDAGGAFGGQDFVLPQTAAQRVAGAAQRVTAVVGQAAGHAAALAARTLR